MKLLDKLLYIVDRRYHWTRSSHEATTQSLAIRAGDVVECAIENTSDILYRVESIDFTTNEARVRRLAADGRSDTAEVYTLAPVMLRHTRNAHA
jgi:hypothetical protein